MGGIMNYINQTQFAEFISVAETTIIKWRAQCKYGIPEPAIYKLKNAGRRKSPHWLRSEVVKFKRRYEKLKSRQLPEHNKIIALNNEGIPRKEMSIMLNISLSKLNKYCSDNKILSLLHRTKKKSNQKIPDEYKTSDSWNVANNAFNLTIKN